MARIAGVDLPREKRLEIGLTCHENLTRNRHFPRHPRQGSDRRTSKYSQGVYRKESSRRRRFEERNLHKHQTTERYRLL